MRLMAMRSSREQMRMKKKKSHSSRRKKEMKCTNYKLAP